MINDDFEPMEEGFGSCLQDDTPFSILNVRVDDPRSR